MIRRQPKPIAITAGLLLLGAAALASCGRGTNRSSPVLSSAMRSGGALNAGGEAPLWALQIRNRNVNFSSEKIASIALTQTGSQPVDHGQMWTGDAGGRPFRATITAVPCKDAATGLTYPLTARVEAVGFVYQGCATKAGQGLGPRK